MKSKNYKRTKVYKLAIEVLTKLNKDSSFVDDWFTSPHVALNFKIPSEIYKTAHGKKQIEDFLGRLQHGVINEKML